jgi:hypothetical protein
VAACRCQSPVETSDRQWTHFANPQPQPRLVVRGDRQILQWHYLKFLERHKPAVLTNAPSTNALRTKLFAVSEARRVTTSSMQVARCSSADAPNASGSSPGFRAQVFGSVWFLVYGCVGGGEDADFNGLCVLRYSAGGDARVARQFPTPWCDRAASGPAYDDAVFRHSAPSSA